MPRSQIHIVNRIKRFAEAWSELAPEATFAGMDKAAFVAATKPSQDVREEMESIDLLRHGAIPRRRAADAASHETILKVVNAVKADEDFGEDSGLYRALGYTPKSERRSGLTRKVKSTATALPESGEVA